MLARDQQSVNWVRGLLWELLERLSKVDPEYPCASHVDDLSHVLVVETESDLKGNMLEAGRAIGGAVNKLDLT